MNRDAAPPMPRFSRAIVPPPIAMLMLAVVALAPVAGGCANSSPVEAWQRQLEHYAEVHAKGNPAALVDLAASPTRRTFDHIGERRGLVLPTRTDARGIVVGHRVVDGELWFIYMLGVVRDQGGIVDVNFDRPVVKSLRPVAFTYQADGFRWALGEADERNLERYLSSQRQRWARSHPRRSAANMTYTRFPRPHDRFELGGQQRKVIVRHAETDARWLLQLPDADPQR